MTPIELAFHALHSDVSVTVRAGAALVEALRFALAGYAAPLDTGDAGTLRYEIDEAGPRLTRDGVALDGVREAIDLLPRFELDLYEQLVARARPDTWLLHAAALRRDEGGALLLAGPSGAGKSTLALALVARGAGYISDEIAAVDADGAVGGLARPISFEPHEQPPEPLPGGLRRGGYDARASDGGSTRAVHIQPPPSSRAPSSRARPSARLAAVFVLAHRPDAPPSCRALSSAAALSQLWPLSFRKSVEAMGSATAALDGAALYALSTCTVEGACDAIERALSAAQT